MFTVNKFSGDASITFYTGFPNWDIFYGVFKYLNPGNEGRNISYWVSKLNLNVSEAVYEGENEELIRKRRRSRSLRPIIRLFCSYVQTEARICWRKFGTSFSSFCINNQLDFYHVDYFTYLKLGQINIWPTRGEVSETMPEDFKQKYSSTRVIRDCTEVTCQMLSSLHLTGKLFSNYKHHTTLKGLAFLHY